MAIPTFLLLVPFVSFVVSYPPTPPHELSYRFTPSFIYFSPGHNLETALDGEFIAVDGTSASAPIAGGIISLINTALFEGGMSPLVLLSAFLLLFFLLSFLRVSC